MLPAEGRLLLTFFINFLVAVSQFCTVTFFLVGWFWSVAWGGLMITYSIDYRNALIGYRREAVTAVALDALTKHSLWNRKRVRNLVTQGLKRTSKKNGDVTISNEQRRENIEV
uniref:Uncharacterized protein n=1 Tax=Romanomermis culicivorax TaxID=13658 RepID=A0A915J5Z2_ROMCU